MKRPIAIVGLFLFIISCGPTTYKSYDSDNRNLDASMDSDQLESTIAPYREAVEKTMNEVIGYSDSALVKYAPESPLGNFAADVVFEWAAKTKIPEKDYLTLDNTIALLNFGGLRAPINQGEITVGNIFELMPFDNSITIVKLKPEAIAEMCDYLIQMNGQPVSNVLFDLKPDQYKIYVNEKPFDLENTLYVVTSNYLASGGDKMDFLKFATEKWDTGVLIRDVFTDYVSAKNHIGYFEIENRMRIEQ